MYFYCICGKEGDLRVLLFRHLAQLQKKTPFLIFSTQGRNLIRVPGTQESPISGWTRQRENKYVSALPAGIVCQIALSHNQLEGMGFLYRSFLGPLAAPPVVGLHPAGLQGLYRPSFETEERAQSQQRRHQWSHG